jgi:hypothetical protein
MLLERTGGRWPASSWVIWLLVVVAPAPWLSAGSSMGPHVLLLLMLGALMLWQGARAPAPGWTLAASAVLLLHFAFALFLTPCQDSFGKSVASEVVLIPLIWALGLLAASHDGRPVDATLRQVLVLVVVSVMIEKAYLVLASKSEYLRPSGIFSEPSHLALSMAPVLAALIVSGRRRNQRYGWLGTLILYALSASATLFVVVAICLLFVTLAKPSAQGRGRTVLRVLAVGTLSVVLVAVSPYRDAFVERILGLGDVSLSANMSSLIYLHGWESALGNFDATSGFGLGINRMGCFPRPETSATDILEFFDLGDSNYNDGSFTFSKLLSEFGVLAIVWQLAVLVFMFRAIRRMRAADPQQYTWHAFLLGGVVVMSLGAFIRGTGYFSGPFLLGLWAMFQLVRVRPHSAPA